MTALNAAGFAELVKEPLRVVDGLFMRAVAAAGGAGCIPAEWGEKEHFIRVLGLEDEKTFSRLPCLNDGRVAGTTPPYNLVRYRGMVQEVFEPESYVAVFKEQAPGAARLVTTKYRECVKPAPGCHLEEVGREGLRQRGACYLVPLPGETEWAKERSAANTAAAVAAWRSRASQTGDVPTTPPPRAPKRCRDTVVEEPPQPPQPVPRRESRRARGNQRVQRSQQGLGNADEFARKFGLNLPLPQEERRGKGFSTACIVKLYDGDMEALKLQDTVEVLGVLSVNPEFADLNASPMGEGLGRDAQRPSCASSALVLRLHALVVRQLPFQHPLLPFTPKWLTEARLVAAYQSCLGRPGKLTAARAKALEQLQRRLNGDTVAAEYLLMLLVSRSFGKREDQALGSLSLNLCSWPMAMGARGAMCLADALSELVPRAVYLAVTAEALNEKRWRPSKDCVANRLLAGRLQLAAGSLLVLDETMMGSCQLSEAGVSARAAISSLVLDQLLLCDVHTHVEKVPLELYCLLVSKDRSIIKHTVTMPIQATEVASNPKPSEPGSLDAARFLLGVVTRRPRPMNISDEVGQIFTSDFMLARQQRQVPTELGHAWMSLARARCLTYGEEDLSVARWKEVLQLEEERLNRCVRFGVV